MAIGVISFVCIGEMTYGRCVVGPSELLRTAVLIIRKECLQIAKGNRTLLPAALAGNPLHGVLAQLGGI